MLKKLCGWVVGKTDKTPLSISTGDKNLFARLAFFFSYDPPRADKLNFGDKLRNVKKVLNVWKCRKLTLIGRINIAVYWLQ